MGFSAKQVRALKREIDYRNVRTRQVQNRELSYVEGWYVIAEANRIFGFDGWTRETVEARCVLNREIRGTFSAVYAAKVRITVFANGRTVVREGHGTGEGQGGSPGEIHDIALKAAETDATKRALATFGKPFGLSLYAGDRNRAQPERRPLPSPRYRPGPLATLPSPQSDSESGKQAAAATSNDRDPDGADLPACGPELLEALQTPQSALPHGYPRRIRDRAHLKFVTNQLCLKCARWPSDAHHVQFAQPRAMGMKVSDEFVVPLCRLHHREVHHARNELAWWRDLKIEPLEVAQKLWQQSHHKKAAAPQLRAAPETQPRADATDPTSKVGAREAAPESGSLIGEDRSNVGNKEAEAS